MSRTLIIFLISLLAFSIKFNAQIALMPKADYPYLLYLPEEYPTNERSFPLVIYLGGGSQSGDDLNKLKTYGVPYYIEQGHENVFIVIAPQCPKNKYWMEEN